MRNTKIVATLGPASDSPETIRSLMEAGVDVFRLNASHGTHAEHGARIDAVRRLGAETGRTEAILLDLQGPKIRLGTFKNGGCELIEGETFILTTETIEGDCQRATINYPDFPRDVKPGDRVLIADGSVELRVLASEGNAVRCRVVVGGPVSDRKGVNLPGVAVSTPSLTEKDIADLQFGLAAGIDLVALSFVRRGDDVLRLRRFLDQAGAALPIVAKIEKPEAWKNFDEILDVSDGIMVARGDLGVEMALEKVPQIQKAIIERCRQRARFVITATQMLESMVASPVPTRAEVSDVANAIEDGTDAVMLSAETSAGRYPIEASRMMARIAAETDCAHHRGGFQHSPLPPNPGPAEIVADAAYRAARLASPAAIAVFTDSGATARLVARYRPPVPIYAFTPSAAVVRQLNAVYGVRPLLVPAQESSDTLLATVDRLLQARAGLKPNDAVVIVAGFPVGRTRPANIMKLHRVGELG